MGSEMSQLFAEVGLSVSAFDVAGNNVDALLKHISSPNSVSPEVRARIEGFKSYEEFAQSLGGKDSKKLFLLSIKHGSPADEVLRALEPWLRDGDVILDGGNEWYQNTERRQRELAKRGVQYIGMGVCRFLFNSSHSLFIVSQVSGGYQSARRGPSLSPGGDAKTLQQLMPLLEAFAVKDDSGRPCVARIGPGGSGHYVKMVHNGIEHGMMGALNEAWELLFKCQHTKLERIADIFERWTTDGELVMRHIFIQSYINFT